MDKPLIVITGASSGIGAAMAQVFSHAGHPVGLIARNLDAMEKLNLPNSLCQSVDVTDYDALIKAMHSIQNKFGPLDCLVNNAGFVKCILLAENGQVELEVCVSKLGNTFLKTPSNSIFQERLEDLICKKY